MQEKFPIQEKLNTSQDQINNLLDRLEKKLGNLDVEIKANFIEYIEHLNSEKKAKEVIAKLTLALNSKKPILLNKILIGIMDTYASRPSGGVIKQTGRHTLFS